MLPSDRHFTTSEIMTNLEAMDPGKVWRKRSVDSHISRLRDRGAVKRVRKAQGGEPANYARVGADVPKVDFEGMTMLEVMRAVLTKPMTVTELIVAMKERGFESLMEWRALMNQVRKLLRERGEISQEGLKWAVI